MSRNRLPGLERAGPTRYWARQGKLVPRSVPLALRLGLQPKRIRYVPPPRLRRLVTRTVGTLRRMWAICMRRMAPVFEKIDATLLQGAHGGEAKEVMPGNLAAASGYAKDTCSPKDPPPFPFALSSMASGELTHTANPEGLPLGYWPFLR